MFIVEIELRNFNQFEERIRKRGEYHRAFHKFANSKSSSSKILAAWTPEVGRNMNGVLFNASISSGWIVARGSAALRD